MNLFNFTKNQNGASPIDDPRPEKNLLLTDSSQSESTVPKLGGNEIPEHVFIEASKNKVAKASAEQMSIKVANDIHTLYRYLEQNLEKRGYEDALINPDTSYMEENVLFISNDLQLLIAKVKTYYAAYLRTVDFHIESRSRSGMLETVSELVTHKETIAEEMNTVETIGKDADLGKGLCQNLILGYKKGFRNGFAAITYNTVLGRKNNP